jgi:hypothetical protein
MQLLFRLPFLLLEAVVRGTVSAVGAIAKLVRRDAAADVVTPVVPPGPVRSGGPAYRAPAAPPPPTAEEAIERRFQREPAPPAPAPRPRPAQPRPARPRPAPEPAAPPPPVGEENRHVDREAEVVESFGPADDVVAIIEVAEPWSGYDGMPAAAVVLRVREADQATKGVVRLYEQRHKNRATVLRATG